MHDQPPLTVPVSRSETWNATTTIEKLRDPRDLCRNFVQRMIVLVSVYSAHRQQEVGRYATFLLRSILKEYLRPRSRSAKERYIWNEGLPSKTKPIVLVVRNGNALNRLVKLNAEVVLLGRSSCWAASEIIYQDDPNFSVVDSVEGLGTISSPNTVLDVYLTLKQEDLVVRRNEC